MSTEFLNEIRETTDRTMKAQFKGVWINNFSFFKNFFIKNGAHIKPINALARPGDIATENGIITIDQ
jgi:hypothetical protein